jgi:hypothetical protein
MRGRSVHAGTGPAACTPSPANACEPDDHILAMIVCFELYYYYEYFPEPLLLSCFQPTQQACLT